MKKFLFISNISTYISNFSLPSILAAQKMGYEVHMAADYSEFNDDPEKYNVTIHHINLHRFPLHPKNIGAYKEMSALIKNEGFDVIHCNTPVGGLLGRLCGSRYKVRKIIYTAHGFHFYKGAPLINSVVYKTVEKLLAKKTDTLITINTEDYAAAQKFKLKKGGKVYYVKGVGVDTEQFANAPKSYREELRSTLKVKENEIMLISVGELNQNKNNEVIIRALSQCENKNVRYFLCGEGEKKEYLQNLAAQLGVSERVHFLGFRNDIPALFRAADIFVMPSFREGLSRSIMEAMSASLPCIVSRIRGNVDLVVENEGGLLVSPSDHIGFARAIDIVAGDKGLREKMGTYNSVQAQNYNTENIKRDILKIFSEVI